MKNRPLIRGILLLVLTLAVLTGIFWLQGASAGSIFVRLLLVLLCCCVGFLSARVHHYFKDTSRAAVEKDCAKILKDAFSDRPAARKQLIDAIRHLMLRRAAAQGEQELEALKPICRTGSDYYAVHGTLAFWYGNLDGERKDTDKALAELHALEAMGLLDLDALLLLLNLYLDRKDLDAAERYGEAVIAAAPDNSTVYHQMAYVAFYRNDLKKAIALAEKAAAMDRHPYTCRFLAAAYQLDGQEKLAKQYYRWALASGMPQRQIQQRIDELCKEYAEMNQKETV